MKNEEEEKEAKATLQRGLAQYYKIAITKTSLRAMGAVPA